MKLKKNNKIRTPIQDKLLKIFSGILLVISAFLLLFPIYWMVSSSTKDEAQISALDHADFSFTIRDQYDLEIKTDSNEISYTYDEFKRDSTLMIWSIYGEYKNSSLGKITVNWVEDNSLKAATSLKELDYRINYVYIFPGEINPTTIEKNIDEIYEIMEDLDCFKFSINKKYKSSKANTGGLSDELVEFVNGLTINQRGDSSRPAFDIENICKGCNQKKYWIGLFDNFKYAFKYFEIKENVSIGKIFLNSLIISVVAVLFQWVFSAGAAFAVVKLLPRKLGNIITVLFIITMMIPSIVYIVPLYKIAAENDLLNRLLTVIIPGIPNATAFILFKGYFSSLPNDLYEASKIDGANVFKSYFNIFVPLSLPMFGVIGLLVFLGNWNDLLWPSMVLKDTQFQTFSIIINRLLGTVSTGSGVGYPVALALSVISMLPTIVVFLIFERQLVKGIAFGGIK